MRTSLLTSIFAISVLANASAYAVPSNPFTYTLDILDTFTELEDDPANSATIVYEGDGTINPFGELFIAWAETPAQITIGSTQDMFLDASYDGLALTLHNSSQSTNGPVDITAYLFATYLDEDGATWGVDGDQVLIAEDTSGYMTLEFDDILEEGRILTDYGFIIAVDENYGSGGSHVVATVPEPSTLAAMGVSLLTAGFVARRKAVI